MPPVPHRPETRNIIPETVNAAAVTIGVGKDSEVSDAGLREAFNDAPAAVSAVPPPVTEKHSGMSNVPNKDLLQPSKNDMSVSLKGYLCPSFQSAAVASMLNITDPPQRPDSPTTLQNGLGSDHVGQNTQIATTISKGTNALAKAPEKRLSEQILEPQTGEKVDFVDIAGKLTSSP